MSATSINDWDITLGFDSSKVDKGLDRIEKRMARFSKVSASKTRRASSTNLLGETRGSVVRQGNELAKANALERKRQSAEVAIRKGNRLRVDTAQSKDTLKSSNVQVIERERLALVRQIKAQEERITKERTKQHTGRRRVTLNQRMTQEASIGRSRSGAGFAIKSIGGSDAKSVELKRRLNAEIKRLDAAQKRLANTTYVNTKKYEKLRRSIHKASQSVKNLKKEAVGLRSMGGSGGIIKNLTASFGRLGVAAFGAYAIIAGGQKLFQSIKRMDSLKASMLAASGSAQQARIDFEFVRESSDHLGRDLFTSAKGFQAIGAAMRGSFTQAQTKETFLAASEASTAFGLSMEDTQGVMRAFSQIASKGSVQAEELRGQLGDRLPGAFQIAARSMNMTTDELNKMLKAGKVASKDFLPKFSAELRRTVRDSGALAAGLQTVVAAQNRMNMGNTEAAERIGEAGGKEIFKDIFDMITKVVRFLTPLGEALTRIITPIVKGIGGLVSMIFSVLTPIAEIIGSVVEIAMTMVDVMGSAFDWAFGIEGVNKNLDGTIEKMSFLKRIFEFIAGVIEIMQGGIEVMNILASSAADEVKAGFNGTETARVTLKDGEETSQFMSNLLEVRDRVFARLPFMDYKDDVTGNIAKDKQILNNVTNYFEINESDNPEATQGEISKVIQDQYSAAIKDND